MSAFTILLGGEVVPTPRLAAQIAGSRVVAADSGMRHAHALGLTPEIWVGDFDSVSEGLAARYAGVPRVTYPQDKDKTDGEIAVDAALARGATAIMLAGAFGGPRADHAYLHLAAALRLAEEGLPVMLTSGRQEGWPLLRGKTEFDFEPGTMFSVIGFTELAGLTLSGVRWPLERRLVPFGSSLTISNTVTGRLEAELYAGRAVLIAHPFPDYDF